MSTEGDGIGEIAMLAVYVAGLLAYNGTFYTTGKQYYEVCREKKTRGADGPHASTVNAIWENCEKITDRGIYKTGIILVPELAYKRDPEVIRIKTACPSLWRDVPGADKLQVVIDFVSESDGLTLVDKFAPAEWLVGRAFTDRWPECDKERQRQGFPKFIEGKDGAFRWAHPCLPCAVWEER